MTWSSCTITFMPLASVAVRASCWAARNGARIRAPSTIRIRPRYHAAVKLINGMKRLAVFLLLTFALGAADRNRHVIVVSLDGFPAYALRDTSLPFPVLRRLIKEGASADAMLPVNPTVT